jgi:hypothetical protein
MGAPPALVTDTLSAPLASWMVAVRQAPSAMSPTPSPDSSGLVAAGSGVPAF